MDYKLLDECLTKFKAIADDWFDERNPFIEFNLKIREFFKKENLEKAKWENFQELGSWLHAFNSVPLARSNAFGRPNYSIQKYRKSFLFLAYGDGSVEERIRAFMNDKVKYTSKFIGKGAISELMGQLFGDELIPMNNRDKDALSFLGVKLESKRGRDFAEEFVLLNQAAKPIKDRYLEVIGKRTTAPVCIEVDQFLSWLYEAKLKNNTAVSVQTTNDYNTNTLIQNASMSYQVSDEGVNYPLNQILYGPPGTGKTYSLINKALEICKVPFDKNNRTDAQTQFKKNLFEKKEIGRAHV